MVELLKHQQEFTDATEHEVMMLAPMATGKTFAQLYDAAQFAVKHPESIQIYLHDFGFMERSLNWECFGDCFKINRANRRVDFDNHSKILFNDIGQRMHRDWQFEKLKGLVIDVLRIDTDIFDMDYRFYRENVLQIMRPPSCQPKQIKITAQDTLHSIVKGGRFKIIEAKEPNPYYIKLPEMFECEWIGNKNN